MLFIEMLTPMAENEADKLGREAVVKLLFFIPSSCATMRKPGAKNAKRAAHASTRLFSPIPLLFRLHSAFVPAPTVPIPPFVVNVWNAIC